MSNNISFSSAAVLAGLLLLVFGQRVEARYCWYDGNNVWQCSGLTGGQWFGVAFGILCSLLVVLFLISLVARSYRSRRMQQSQPPLTNVAFPRPDDANGPPMMDGAGFAPPSGPPPTDANV